jgi:hypothetical protein
MRAGAPCDQWNLEWEKTSCAGRGWAVTVAAGAAGRFFTNFASLPIWKGKRPITIRGPLHLEYDNNDDDFSVRELVEEGHSLAGHRSGSISCWQWRSGVSSDPRSMARNNSAHFIKRKRICESPFRRFNYLSYFAVELRPQGNRTRTGKPHYSVNFGT